MAVITLKNVGLSFPIFDAQNFSLRGKILRAVTGGKLQKGSNKVYTVRALNDINLSFDKGDRVGLIGHNGSGKTTLLKLLAGIYTATEGEVTLNHEPSCLFDMALGMDAEASGYENIIISGLLRGLPMREIKKIMPAIVNFSELGEYLNMPLRTYSAGMRMRLAFSIATTIDPKILLIDEVFGAGDKGFFQKARERMKALVNKAEVLVLATHSTELMTQFCNKVVVLEKGSLKDFGPTQDVLKRYAP